MFSTMNKVGGNHTNNSKVYLIQEIPGTSQGMPKYNIMGAKRYGDLVTLLPEPVSYTHLTLPTIYSV